MNIFNLTQTTEEQRITMALESATEAIRVLRRKLDIAIEALELFASFNDYVDGEYRVARNALDRIENEG